MDTTRLSEGREDLLRHMEQAGYSTLYINRIRAEIDWLCANHDAFDTYEGALDLRAPKTGSSSARHEHSTKIGICKHFDVDGELPEFGRRHILLEQSAYHKLCEEFTEIVDLFRRQAREQGLSDRTITVHSSVASNFLLAMQGLGRASLAEVTEGDVLSRYADGRRNNEAVDLVRVLRSDLGPHSAEAARVAELVPKRGRRRANVDYLRPDEVEAIREALRDEASEVCLRDRAIVTTLFYTGLRASDVAGLRLDDIDWEADEIRLTQKKTGVPLELPLTARVGNAIYDYLEGARPEGDDDPHVFLSKRRPHGPITTQAVDRAVGNVMDAAGVRVGGGRGRGAHLFRHNVAMAIVGSGMQPALATAALGHEDPGTVNRYLHADVEHLRMCALDVSVFGLAEGVFDV